MRVRLPSPAITIPMAGVGILLVVWWLHGAAADVPIRWSDDSMGQECQFLSSRTERELATAGRLPLVALTSVMLLAAVAGAAAIRSRVHADDADLVRGLIISASVLGAVLCWVVYGATGLFAAFASLGLGFVALVVIGAMTLSARGGDTGRRSLWAAFALEAALIALIPLAVAFATGVSESSVCMSSTERITSGSF